MGLFRPKIRTTEFLTCLWLSFGMSDRQRRRSREAGAEQELQPELVINGRFDVAKPLLPWGSCRFLLGFTPTCFHIPRSLRSFGGLRFDQPLIVGGGSMNTGDLPTVMLRSCIVHLTHMSSAMLLPINMRHIHTNATCQNSKFQLRECLKRRSFTHVVSCLPQLTPHLGFPR